MVTIWGIWGFLSLALGFVFLIGAKNAIHKIEAGLAFLIATVSLGMGCVVEAV